MTFSSAQSNTNPYSRSSHFTSAVRPAMSAFGVASTKGITGRAVDTFSSSAGSLQSAAATQTAKLLKEPMHKLGAGLLLKGIIPYALLHFPLFRIPFLRDPLIIISGFIFGKNGDKLLKAIPKNTFKGSLNHIHQLGSENFGRLFADPEQFGQATRLVNKLSLSTVMHPKLKIPWKLVDKLVGWVPINAKKFEGLKKLPWVFGEAGGWLHKSVGNLQAMQGFLKSESRDMTLRKELYKRFIRLSPEEGAAAGFRKYMDTHSKDLGVMLGASQAKTLRQAFGDAYQSKFDNFAGKLTKNGFKGAFHGLTAPFPKFVSWPINLFLDRVIAPIFEFGLPSVTNGAKNILSKLTGTKR
jgi:hypothetical protein